ncbi:MAG: hypothetical protein ALAOOOJD_03555 [bacterium]|nr:hypothetical protein [bacterium]
MQQFYRAQINVQVEIEAHGQKNFAAMAHVGNARIAKRAEINRRVIFPEFFHLSGRHADAGFEIMLGAKLKFHQIQFELEFFIDAAQHFHRLGGDVDADAVAGDHCDFLHEYLSLYDLRRSYMSGWKHLVRFKHGTGY